ncbi:MAG: LptF/LptG family permease [Fimbriimonadaceae bacterium]|nr:LptF/LptG family permease [Fimbriimonadaceae bacterium]
MRQIDRYIVKEMMVPLFTGTIVIAMLFMANDLIAIFKNLNTANMTWVMVAQLVLLKFPAWLSLTIPVGLTMGVSLALARLTRENEVTAMRSAGIPIRRLLRPVVLVGLLMTVANWFVVEKLMPPSAARFRELQTQVALLATGPEFVSNKMMSLDRYTVRMGTVMRQPNGDVEILDVLAIENPQPNTYYMYVSKRGTYDAGVWTFEAPTVFVIENDLPSIIKSGKPLTINEPIRIADVFGPPMAEEMTAEDLKTAIDQAAARGDSNRTLEVAYHFKFSLPASCVVFAIAGAMASIRYARTGAFAGVLISFGLVVLYYNLFVICREIIGRNGWLPPIGAAWLPNLIYLAFAIILARRIE